MRRTGTDMDWHRLIAFFNTFLTCKFCSFSRQTLVDGDVDYFKATARPHEIFYGGVAKEERNSRRESRE